MRLVDSMVYQTIMIPVVLLGVVVALVAAGRYVERDGDISAAKWAYVTAAIIAVCSILIIGAIVVDLLTL